MRGAQVQQLTRFHEQRRKSPCTHDLVVAMSPEERGPDAFIAAKPPKYRVFEVWPENFDATSEALHDRDLLDEGICPLLLADFQPSRSQITGLPRSVPWSQASRDITTELQAWRQMLVEPLESRGLICVDFIDYAAALSMGGQLRWLQAHAGTLSDASDRLCGMARKSAGKQDAEAACVALHFAGRVTIDSVTSAIENVFSEVSEARLHIASANLRPNSFGTCCASLLTVARR